MGPAEKDGGDGAAGRVRRIGRTVLVWVVVAVVMFGALWAVQRRLIYFPFGSVPLPPAGVEAVTTTTEDGLDLAGWWVPVADPVGPAVLVFHGNGGNHADRLPLATALTDRGIPVLLAGYRGYGGNPGSPSEGGFATDARAWWDWASGAHDGPLALYGESIGTGVASRLATATDPSAVVLRSPFTSLVDAGRHHYRWLPVGTLLRDRYPVAEHVGEIDAPVLVVFGSGDSIVPPEQSRAVHAAARNPAGLVEVPGADHNDAVMFDGDVLIDAVSDLLQEVGP